MARRTYDLFLRCPTAGCTERPTFYTYTTQRDYKEALARYPNRTDPCSRHRKPDEVLSIDNFVRHRVVVATKVDNLSGLFWRAEGSDKAGSGFEYGPGFKAYAKDFPEGTRLLITAEIELPCTCNGGWSVDENYQPEDYEMTRPLEPEKGLIPCGHCNHGGWDAPWPPAAPSQQEGEDG